VSAPAWTPGPWEVDSPSGCDVVSRAPNLNPKRTHGYGCGNDFVASLNDGEYHEYYDGAEQIANARLISAAPDLFAALEGLLNITGDMHNADFDEFNAAEAALAKARGQ